MLSCNDDELVLFDEELKQVISDELVLFDTNATPEELQDLYQQSDLLLFGEKHYVQEHHEFILSQLEELSNAGYTIIHQELFHCFSWMIEDYLSGEIEELPEFILYFDAALIKGVKQFNETVENSRKFNIVYIDVNHWSSNFTKCIHEIEKVIGQQGIFSAIKNNTPDTETYAINLDEIKALLESHSETYISEWGSKWHKRVYEVVLGEIASSEYRMNKSNEWREAVMFQNIESSLNAYPNTKHLVNVGSFHAQKQVYMGSPLERIGKRLDENYPNTSSIVFVGMKGETKSNFAQQTNETFDLANAGADDMIREVYEQSQDRHVFLPLSNRRFINTPVKISYSSKTTITAPIGYQFDALITFPEVSTFESMNTYEVN